MSARTFREGARVSSAPLRTTLEGAEQPHCHRGAGRPADVVHIQCRLPRQPLIPPKLTATPKNARNAVTKITLRTLWTIGSWTREIPRQIPTLAPRADSHVAVRSSSTFQDGASPLNDFIAAHIAEAAPKLITKGWTPCNCQNAFRTPQSASHRKDEKQ